MPEVESFSRPAGRIQAALDKDQENSRDSKEPAHLNLKEDILLCSMGMQLCESSGLDNIRGTQRQVLTAPWNHNTEKG